MAKEVDLRDTKETFFWADYEAIVLQPGEESVKMALMCLVAWADN